MKALKHCSLSLLVGLLLTLSLTACNNGNSQEAEGEGPYTLGEPIEDSTYALIVESEYGTDTMTTAEFRQQLNLVKQRMPQMQGLNEEQSERIRRNLAEEFVLRHLLTGEANRLNLQADSAQVEARLQQYRNRFENEEQFQQALQQSNMTVDSLRQMIREQSRLQQLQQQLAREAAAPSAAELDSFRQQRAEQVQAQHILFRVNQDAPQEQVDSVQAVAQSVLDSAQAGTDFAELAQRHSQGPSASRGGQLDYFSRGQMVPPFEEAAFALQDSGDIAPEPVRTRFGYHVIRLTGRRNGELMDTAQARQMIMRDRQQQAVQEAMDELRAKATVRVNQDIVNADLNESTSAAGTS